MHPDATLLNRFWSKVDVCGPGDCWLWKASRTQFGYGKFWLDGHLHNASNAAWRLTFGPLRPGYQVNHHCGTPACCNPAHLYAGTPLQNTADRRSRGRANNRIRARGSRNWRAALVEEDIPIIRMLLKAGMSLSAIARYFRVDLGAISCIRDGKTWKHVP